VIKQRKRLVDATVAALHLRTAYGILVAPATIRSWAKRGRINRYGDGHTGAHFDLNEIDRIGRERVAEDDVAS
jgi:hypothetical protein